MTTRILVIEDDPDIGNLVELHLRDQAFDVDRVQDGETGLEEALHGEHALVILDLMLPGMHGLDICRRLRASQRQVPILMLTARSTGIDRVLGLELGADDYLTKPFYVQELVARVKAILRRAGSGPTGDSALSSRPLDINGISISIDRRRVTVDGEPRELTAREFDLLHFFASHPGHVFSRTQLLDRVWGYGHDGYEHTVNSHINRLRKKIEPNPHDARYILTVWGVGYKFAER
ncbi:MAG: response regulator transcription factor [Pseudomonadota bacterium]|nr:response regulator transcription factor [Pseudomonadota bacterium]